MSRTDSASEYLLTPSIYRTISSALNQLYKANPHNPLEYLANTLLTLSKKQDIIEEETTHKQITQQEYTQMLLGKLSPEQHEETQTKDKTLKFVQTAKNTTYINDILDQFCDIIQTITNSSGVYIGELTRIKKPITDSDIVNPPADESAPQVIKYIATNQDHIFMKENCLEPGKGVTFSAIKQSIEDTKQEDKEKEAQDKKEEHKVEATEEEKIRKSMVFVKEVLREEKMHYFKVPKLGSYIAMPISHLTCLNDISLEAAITDHVAYYQRIEEQEKSKKEYEDMAAEAKAKAEENEEEYKPPTPPTYKQFKLSPYIKTTNNYVLCFDTMGQDRVYTEKQISDSIDITMQLVTIWEKKEEEMLTHDMKMRLGERERIKQYLQSNATKIEEEEAQYMKSKMESAKPDDKEFIEKYYAYCYATQSLTGGIYAELLLTYPEYHIIKYQQVFQALLFLLGYTRSEVCFLNTNNLNWRDAKKYINQELLDKMKQYQVRGAKEVELPKYMIINKIMLLISDLKEEDIKPTYYIIALIIKWIKTSIEIRMEDIKRRKQRYQQILDNRANQEKQNEEIQKEREDALAKAKEAKSALDHSVSKESNGFKEEEFLAEWNASHPSVLVEEPPKPDMDADYEEQ